MHTYAHQEDEASVVQDLMNAAKIQALAEDNRQLKAENDRLRTASLKINVSAALPPAYVMCICVRACVRACVRVCLCVFLHLHAKQTTYLRSRYFVFTARASAAKEC